MALGCRCKEALVVWEGLSEVELLDKQLKKRISDVKSFHDSGILVSEKPAGRSQSHVINNLLKKKNSLFGVSLVGW